MYVRDIIPIRNELNGKCDGGAFLVTTLSTLSQASNDSHLSILTAAGGRQAILN